MRIAMEMGGFTAAKADKLRKGMGKKKMEIVDALEPEFMAGASERSYDLRVAERVWSRHAQVRRVRVQQEPRRGLRARLVPDGVPQGALPARVHGRRAHELHRQERDHRQVHRRVQPGRA